MVKTSKLIAIDGNSLLYRAYYAFQKPMITKQGLYTQGVFGFLNMLTKIRKEYAPDYIVVAFDRKAPTFRHKEYKEYKAGRRATPSELVMQLPLLKDLLLAMNIKILEIDGFEADDIIGTVAKRAEAEGLTSIIFTGDRDELQLVTDMTKVILTKKGVTQFEEYDRLAIEEKYGFAPEYFIDYKGLMGDKSDNLPGIPGVGDKTAMSLIQKFGSIENLKQHFDEITSDRLKKNLVDNIDIALMSRRLATIVTNVPIEFTLEECKVREPNYNELINVYVKLEFNSYLRKLKSVYGDVDKRQPDSNSSKKSDILPKKQYNNDSAFILNDVQKFSVFTKAEWSKIADKFSKRVILKVFHDNNHKRRVNVYGISLLSTDAYCYISTETDIDLLREVLHFLCELQVSISGHMLQRDYYALLSCCYYDATLNMIKSKDGVIFHTEFDTALAAYLLEPTHSGNYNLSLMAIEYLKRGISDEDEAIKKYSQIDLFSSGSQAYEEYGYIWCVAVAELLVILAGRIDEEGLKVTLKEIEIPLIEVLAVMEYHGFAIDKNELNSIGSTLKERLSEIIQSIYDLAGEEFNINSTKQLGYILFEKLGLKSGKKTKTGYSTGADILEKLRDEHPIVALILEYRMLSKLLSTYVDGLIPLIGDDGKIRAHFQQTVTATGRISCTEPNLQNIPIRQELGRKLRRVFISESSGNLLVGADYSQIELRILAHLSEDESLIQAFKNGEDIHNITAAKVFNVPIEDVTSIQRNRAKVVNFGVIYGMSGFGLASDLGISQKEASKYIAEYFKKYKAVKDFLDCQIQMCKKNGYLTTIQNRKRYIPEIHASSFVVRQLGERLAMNTPIQGSAADIIKIAMIRVQRALFKAQMKTKLILQIHDELVLDVPLDELEQAKSILKENMQSAMTLLVPLESSLNVGANWYDLK